MSNHTPSQQKRFDDIYELYHFNPFHDPRNGQFTSSRGGSRGRRKYINPDGTFTEKVERRLRQHHMRAKQKELSISVAEEFMANS